MSDNSTPAVGENTATNGKAKITTQDAAVKLAHKRKLLGIYDHILVQKSRSLVHG